MEILKCLIKEGCGVEFDFIYQELKSWLGDGCASAMELDGNWIVSIPLCELPSFVVAVGAQGPRALELCTQELNVFRRFLCKTSETGLSFREYCMSIHDEVDQRNIMVRELLWSLKING